MLRLLLVLLAAPLLLAPVRLRDSTPGFFSAPVTGPAPESYSLPPAEALITPTVIFVSPTLVPGASPTIISGTLNLPLQVTPTAPQPQVIIIQQQAAPNLMNPTAAALCVRGMDLVQNIAMLSYGQERSQATMTLSLAAAAAMGEAANRQWPNLTAFNKAVRSLPWFYPNKTELRDAVIAARTLCTQ